jgi:hypothetical protein
LYATSFRDEGISEICKYSLTTFSSVPVATALLDTPLINAHAMRYENGFLYVTSATFPPWAAKIRTSDMMVMQSCTNKMNGVFATDDFGITDKYMFVGTESKASEPANGTIYRISKTDLTSVFPIATGTKSGTGECYGVTYDGKWVWAIFNTNPGTITRIDPVSLQFTNYKLDYSSPNEIVSDGKRLFITYWAQDPGVIQAFDPSYLEGKEIP